MKELDLKRTPVRVHAPNREAVQALLTEPPREVQRSEFIAVGVARDNALALMLALYDSGAAKLEFTIYHDECPTDASTPGAYRPYALGPPQAPIVCDNCEQELGPAKFTWDLQVVISDTVRILWADE